MLANSSRSWGSADLIIRTNDLTHFYPISVFMHGASWNNSPSVPVTWRTWIIMNTNEHYAIQTTLMICGVIWVWINSASTAAAIMYCDLASSGQSIDHYKRVVHACMLPEYPAAMGWNRHFMTAEAYHLQVWHKCSKNWFGESSVSEGRPWVVNSMFVR